MKVTREHLQQIIREEIAKLDEIGNGMPIDPGPKPAPSTETPHSGDPGSTDLPMKRDKEPEEGEELEEGGLGDFSQKEMEKERYGWESKSARGTPKYGASGLSRQSRLGSLYEPEKKTRRKERKFRWDENKKLTKESLRNMIEDEIKKIVRSGN